ncbi:hypothetical protein CCM_08443 [Cordyceps militaris CM01]|uniref:Uncharacterized protein n=1 Tax=Cordyceps militaris (strain CM01) TaxID=983644 RepID=G3JRA3_CORMM|nr:uncharacterized protein CCM_08443 [Cordyceps militaris CM01]EGX88399.1 hypothetical protein CCM_08443 [Cordyceps militaris CM01]
MYSFASVVSNPFFDTTAGQREETSLFLTQSYVVFYLACLFGAMRQSCSRGAIIIKQEQGVRNRDQFNAHLASDAEFAKTMTMRTGQPRTRFWSLPGQSPPALSAASHPDPTLWLVRSTPLWFSPLALDSTLGSDPLERAFHELPSEQLR